MSAESVTPFKFDEIRYSDSHYLLEPIYGYLKATIGKLKAKAASLDYLTRSIDTPTILREIEFEPQYKQAGVSILNYFGDILNQKYPDIEVKVRIEQDGLKVRMEIETPEGKKDVVEEALEEYGLVVTGRKPPGELLKDEHHLMLLANKLELAHTEIRTMSRLIGHIESEKAQLSAMNERLMKMVESGFERADEGRRDLKDITELALLQQNPERLLAAFGQLHTAISSSHLPKDQQTQVTEAVTELEKQSKLPKDQQNPDVIKQAAEKIESASKGVEGIEKIWDTLKPMLPTIAAHLRGWVG